MLQPTLKQMREDATGEYFPITSDDYQEEILENPRAKPNLSDRLKTLKIGGISFAGALSQELFGLALDKCQCRLLDPSGVFVSGLRGGTSLNPSESTM